MARPRLFERIKTGFEAALDGDCRETVVWMPDPVRPYAPDSVRPYAPDSVAALRVRLRMTQADFVALLNESVKTVEAREQGLRPPSAAAARLLQIVEDPEAFSRVV